MSRPKMTIAEIRARWQDETMDANDTIDARNDIHYLLDVLDRAANLCGRAVGVCIPERRS